MCVGGVGGGERTDCAEAHEDVVKTELVGVVQSNIQRVVRLIAVRLHRSPPQKSRVRKRNPWCIAPRVLWGCGADQGHLGRRHFELVAGLALGFALQRQRAVLVAHKICALWTLDASQGRILGLTCVREHAPATDAADWSGEGKELWVAAEWLLTQRALCR